MVCQHCGKDATCYTTRFRVSQVLAQMSMFEMARTMGEHYQPYDLEASVCSDQCAQGVFMKFSLVAAGKDSVSLQSAVSKAYGLDLEVNTSLKK